MFLCETCRDYPFVSQQAVPLIRLLTCMRPDKARQAATYVCDNRCVIHDLTSNQLIIRSINRSNKQIILCSWGQQGVNRQFCAACGAPCNHMCRCICILPSCGASCQRLQHVKGPVHCGKLGPTASMHLWLHSEDAMHGMQMGYPMWRTEHNCSDRSTTRQGSIAHT